MATLAEIRAKYPGAYDHVDDQKLADALYAKYYSHADRREFDARVGLKPYQNAMEAMGTAIGNAPARAQMGTAGIVQATGEALNDSLNAIAADPAQFDGVTQRPPQFDQFARYAGYDAKSADEIEAVAADLWSRFQNPATRDAVIQEIGQNTAKTGLRGQLTMQQLEGQTKPIDTAPGSIEGYAAGAVGSLAEMAPALAASIATGNPLPAMVFAGVQGGGMGYAAGREGGLSADDARKYGLLYAAAEGLPEALPVGVILREGGGLIASMAKGAAAEGFQEGFTEALQFAIDKGFISPDMPWSEAWPRLKDAAITGALSGVGMAGVARAGQAGMGKAAEISQQVIGGVTDAAGNVVQQGMTAAQQMAERMKGTTLQERVDAFVQQDALAPENPPTQVLPAIPSAPLPGATEATVPAQSSAPPAGTAAPYAGDAAGLLREFEGFASKPYWDVNAYRTGYGSDTITRADGSVVKVEPGMTVTREDAERDLARRAAEFADTARNRIGPEIWDALPANVQAALTSNAYNYGSLQDAIVAAAKTGDVNAIADAVAAQAGQNNGVNATRRAKEAAIIRGEAYTPSAGPTVTGGAAQPTETAEIAPPAISEAPPAAEATAAAPEAAPQQLPAPTAASQQTMPGTGTAKPQTVTTPTGQKIQTRPEVVDISQLQKAEGDLQPRDRSRAASTAQIEDIAINLDPARLMPSTEADRGAPIVGPDGVVESGNGRVAALRRAFEAYPEKAEAYRQALRAQGYDVPEGGMPILISRRTSDLTPEQRREFVTGANTSAIARMSATEVATNDAKLIDRVVLDAVEPGASMTSAALTNPKNPFVSAFLAKLPQSERAGMADKDGRLNADGVRRIQNALTAAAYGDPELVSRQAEATDDNSKSITGALADVAAEWAGMRQDFANGLLDPAYDLTPALTEALRTLSRAREKAAQQSRPVKALINEALNQTDMLGGEVSSEAAQFIRAFYNGELSSSKSRDDIAAFLRAIVEDVQSAGQSQMFGDAPKPSEIIDAAKRKTERQADTSPGLFASRSSGTSAESSGQGDRKSAVQPASAETTRPDALTETPAFKRWFGDSKVVDANGKPLVVYHGTNQDFSVFDASRGGASTGTNAGATKAFFFTDSAAVANQYANQAGKRTVANVAAYERESARLQKEVARLEKAANRTGNWDAYEQAVMAWEEHETAALYADDSKGVRNIDAYLSIQNPMVVDFEGGRLNADRDLENIIDEAKDAGHDGLILRNLEDSPQMGIVSTQYAVFKPTQIKSATDNRGTFDPKNPDILSSERVATKAKSFNTRQAERPEGEPETWDALADEQAKLEFKPAKGYVEPFSDTGMPQRPANNKVAVSGGAMSLDKVTKRDEPRKKLLAIVGDRIYQQRIRNKKQLGFYRPRNSEIRIKHYDDIEVMAHEAAHFLDFDRSLKGMFTRFRQQFAPELDPLSYTSDPKLINIEGFAEFVRLWATNHAAAVKAAPNAVKAFERAIVAAGIGRKMRAFQKAAHGWYWQGTLAQARGKSGESDHFLDSFNAMLRSRPGAQFLQGFLDQHYGAKLIERMTTGKISDATQSAWKLARLTAGADSMTEAAIMFGTPTLNPDGTYGFGGKSLADVFMPVTRKGDAALFDQLMEYFKGRRASELMRQGRENLFTKQEIAALLDLGKQHPEFAKVFDAYQQFNREMLDFYVDMDLITPDQRDAFQKNNTEYVPFHRVLDKVGQEDGGNTANDIKKRLTGGEQNTREIVENIAEGLAANIRGALQARAKAQLFRNIRDNQAGSEFAVEIPAGSKKIEATLDQFKGRFAEILLNLGYEVTYGGQVIKPSGQALNAGQPVDIDNVEALLKQHPELLQFWLINQMPKATETVVEPVIMDGKLHWFEVKSPLLVDMLTAPGRTPLIIRSASAVKRFITGSITSLPPFMIPNIVRDTVSAGALTQSKFRPFIESGRGLAAYVRKSEAYKQFLLNGGMFGGRLDDGIGLDKPKRRAQQIGVKAATQVELLGRHLAGLSRVSAPFEQGTRVGQFARAREAGVNALEAAFQGREISGDFAQMGRNTWWRWVLQITPFMNAGLRGIEQLSSHLIEADGKAGVTPKNFQRFAVQAATKFGAAITAFSILMWLLNHDDERYKALTADQRARFWHVWTPDGQHWQIPKPYGVGFIFGDLPEAALNFIVDKDGEAAAQQLSFGLLNNFWVLDYPGLLTPFIEAAGNRKWNGAPIIPDNLKDVDPRYQYTDRTPEIYRALGRTLNISPLLAEHYVKGFTGYLEGYMVDATEAMMWNKEAWGERPFSRSVFDSFTHQFNGAEVPYRTRWTDGYYSLKERAMGKAQTYAHLFNNAQRSTSDLTEFTASEVNLMLRQMATIMRRVDSAFSNGDGQLQAIKYNPDLTAEEKETRIEAWYKRKNDVLSEQYQRLQEIVEKMEADTP